MILSSKIYPLEVIQTAAFYASDVVQVQIVEKSKDRVIVELISLDGSIPLRKIRQVFFRELIAAAANLQTFAETTDLRSIFARSAYFVTEEGQQKLARMRQDIIGQVHPAESSNKTGSNGRLERLSEADDQASNDKDQPPVHADIEPKSTCKPFADILCCPTLTLRPELDAEACIVDTREVDGKQVVEVQINPACYQIPDVLAVMEEMRGICDIVFESRSRKVFTMQISSETVTTDVTILGQEFIEQLIQGRHKR
jgi:hypothetical protein